ncbi:MAG: peptidylprolyl isomerase [Pseudomonadota bacterium]|nr:peptidylprolyl isomerase [Pseudomonadota bacterium]
MTISSRRTLLRRSAALLCGLALSSVVFAADTPVTAPPQVLLKTSMGDIVLELNPEKAPITVANFLQYVKSGFYKGTVFHRVIDGFMIQGGGYDAKLVGKPTNKPIKNESNNGLSNVAYSVAMARGSDHNSATSQFFINVADHPPLDYPGRDGSGYAVFGMVVSGQDVVDKIKGVVVDDMKGQQNVPVVPIVITSATIVKPAKSVK